MDLLKVSVSTEPVLAGGDPHQSCRPHAQFKGAGNTRHTVGDRIWRPSRNSPYYNLYLTSTTLHSCQVPPKALSTLALGPFWVCCHVVMTCGAVARTLGSSLAGPRPLIPSCCTASHTIPSCQDTDCCQYLSLSKSALVPGWYPRKPRSHGRPSHCHKDMP